MRVTDQRVTQERIDTSTVVVNVQRDQFPPVFQNMPYGVSITDSQALNTTIYTVSAVDADLRVSDRMDIESVAGESKSECSLHGDPGNNSISFRYLFCIVLILSIFMSNYLQNENLIFYPSKSWKFFKKMEKGLKCKKTKNYIVIFREELYMNLLVCTQLRPSLPWIIWMAVSLWLTTWWMMDSTDPLTL